MGRVWLHMRGGGPAAAPRMPVLPAGRDECGDPDQFWCYGVYRQHFVPPEAGSRGHLAHVPSSSRGARRPPHSRRDGGVTACHDPLNAAAPFGTACRGRERIRGRNGLCGFLLLARELLVQVRPWRVCEGSVVPHSCRADAKNGKASAAVRTKGNAATAISGRSPVGRGSTAPRRGSRRSSRTLWRGSPGTPPCIRTRRTFP